VGHSELKGPAALTEKAPGAYLRRKNDAIRSGFNTTLRTPEAVLIVKKSKLERTTGRSLNPQTEGDQTSGKECKKWSTGLVTIDKELISILMGTKVWNDAEKNPEGAPKGSLAQGPGW